MAARVWGIEYVSCGSIVARIFKVMVDYFLAGCGSAPYTSHCD
jgi:hypothetical protein